MKKLMVSMSALFLLAGCSSDEKVQENINKGLEAVAEDNFGKAEALFEMALEEAPKDESAKAYLQQVEYIQQASDVEATEAIEVLDKAISLKNGSKIISAKAEQQKEVLESAAKQQATIEKAVEEAKALAEKSQYEASSEKLNSLEADELAMFPELQQQVATLKEANTSAIAKQAEAAKQAAEKAAKQAANPYQWNPGVKQAFEQRILNEGFVDSIQSIRYEEAGVENNEGYLQVYTQFDGQEYRVVRVNVKTGDFSGL